MSDASGRLGFRGVFHAGFEEESHGDVTRTVLELTLASLACQMISTLECLYTTVPLRTWAIIIGQALKVDIKP